MASHHGQAWLVAVVTGLSLLALPWVVKAQAAGSLEPPYQDFGLSTDGDPLYDYLVIQIPVNVTQPGNFRLVATLVSFIVQGVNVTALDGGVHVLEVPLTGWQIYNSKMDGPYQIDITLRDADTFQFLGSDSHTTAAYSYTDFDPPDVLIEAPVSDIAVDLNGDTLYDELWVNFTANVTAPGGFDFESTLLGTQGAITSVSVFVGTLTPGYYTFTAPFLGPHIRDSGEDGPYTASLSVHQKIGSSFFTVSQLEYTTAAYAASSFNRPWARFLPPLSEEVRDTDEDGLWDELLVHVPVEVDRAAEVSVSGSISTANLSVSSEPSTVNTLGAESLTLDAVFEGVGLYSSHVDGPYPVAISLFVTPIGLVNRTDYQTGAYQYVEFRKSSAEFEGVSPEARLHDEDQDGLADFLLVDVPFTVRESGDYFLSGSLSTVPWGEASRLVHLEPGARTVTLTYSGVLLGRGPTDGPWELRLSLRRTDGSFFDVSKDSWDTEAYTRSQFESRPTAELSGTVTDESGEPVRFANVMLLDPSMKFAVDGFADDLGQYRLEAYNGTFYALVSTIMDHGRTQSLTIEGGAAQLDVTLGAAPGITVDLDVRIEDWSTSSVTANYTYALGNQTYRTFADLYGDFDGYASTSELSPLMAWLLRPRGLAPPPVRIAVDNRTLEGSAEGVEQAIGAGDLTVDDPISIASHFAYFNATPAYPGMLHNITLGLPYDVKPFQVKALIRLPEGYDGNLTASTENVTAVKLGPGTWEVDPGSRPDEVGLTELAEVHIEAAPGGPGGSGGLTPLEIALWVLAPVAAGVAIGVGLWLWYRRGKGSPPSTQE